MQHPVGEQGFYQRAAALQTSNGRNAPKHTIASSPELRQAAQLAWRKVNSYEDCLQYYKDYHPEYPEALQIAAAKYITNIAENQITGKEMQTHSWDFMQEIQEIKNSLTAAKLDQ